MDYTASLCYVLSADLEAAGAWSPISNLKDPELQRLAGSVLDTLLSYKEIHRCFQEVEALGRGATRGSKL